MSKTVLNLQHSTQLYCSLGRFAFFLSSLLSSFVSLRLDDEATFEDGWLS